MILAIAATMLTGLLSAHPLPPPPSLDPPDIEWGTWSQYGENPTRGQLWYHTTQTKLLHNPDRYDGFIAVTDCDLVGWDAWIKVYPLKRWFHVFIFDCSGHWHTTEWMRKNGIIGELDYYMSRKLGIPRGRGVRGAIVLERPMDI